MDFVSPYSQVWSQAVVIAAAHIAANQRTMRMLLSVIGGSMKPKSAESIASGGHQCIFAGQRRDCFPCLRFGHRRQRWYELHRVPIWSTARRVNASDLDSGEVFQPNTRFATRKLSASRKSRLSLVICSTMWGISIALLTTGQHRTTSGV